MSRKNTQSPKNEVSRLRQDAQFLAKTGKLTEAASLLEKVAALRPQSGEAQHDLGIVYWHAGNRKKAHEHYAAAAALAPDNPYILASHGTALLEQERLGEALESLNRAFFLKSDHYETVNSLGLLFYRGGDMAQAERFFRQVAELKPDWAEGHANLANLLRETGRLSEAEQSYRRALRLAPRNASTWSDLGKLFSLQMKDDDARTCQERAIALSPKLETAWMSLLGILEVSSQLDSLAEAIGRAAGPFPQATWRMTAQAKLLRRRGKHGEAIALMEQHRPEGKTLQDASFFFELGQLYDREGDADKAFESFQKAHATEKTAMGAALPDKTVFPAGIRHIREQLTPQMIQAPLPDNGFPDPVFIVGFPRSGTTLLDQILSSHPAIEVAEEQPGVQRMMQQLSKIIPGTRSPGFWDERYPACLSQLQPDDITALRSAFFEGHGRQDSASTGLIFVDKMPLNMIYAGLIWRVFPKAKFLLALRHPCDAVLSCFMQQFKLNPTMVQFTNLEDAALFYDGVFNLWEHHAAHLPLDVHKVYYEDIVDNFRPTVESALSFLGLPWDDAVLAYDETAKKRHIQTPSYDQVVQKIYRRASGRWLRYRRHMLPVLDILEPHARRYGYKMEE